MVDKVQPSPLIRAEVWCVFSETKFIKCALAFFGPDLNGNEVLIAELVGTQDFRGNSGHFYGSGANLKRSAPCGNGWDDRTGLGTGSLQGTAF